LQDIASDALHLNFPPLSKNEFTAATVAAAEFLTSSDISRIDGMTVTFSTDPFWVSFPEMIPVSVIHPTLGLDLHYDTDRHRCQITKMDPGTPAHTIRQWISSLRHAFVPRINKTPVHTIDDSLQAIAKARQLDKKTVDVALTNDDALNCLSLVGLPQLHVDQIWIMKQHISHTAPAVVNTAVSQLLVSAAATQLERMTGCRMDSD
jgi:hypothetical protein